MIDVIILTLLVNITSTFLGMFFGLLLGYRLYFSKSKSKNLQIYLVKTLMAIPPVVLGLVLFLLLKNNGPLHFLDILYQPASLVLAQTLLIIPLVAGNVYQLLISKGQLLFFTLSMYKLNYIDKIKFSLFEFKNELLFILILAFSRAISEVGAVMIVGGNIKDHTRIMTTAIANLKSQGNYNEALLYGVTLLIIAFIIQLFLTKLSIEENEYENL